MRPEQRRLLGLVAAVSALALVVGVLAQSIFDKAGGPDGQIITRLKQLERDGLELPVGDAGVLRSERASYQRISVVLDADGEGATVTSTLDFVGRFGATRVSSLGLERERYVLRSGDWEPERSDAPRLVGIVAALEGRRRAIEQGRELELDAGVPFPEVKLPRRYSSEAWFIRSEREQVELAEDSRLVGTTPDRPVDERRTTRLTLFEDAGSFRFPGGTM
jgi:hypothetical protein